MGWSGWRRLETRGVLVAGRSYDFSDFTRAQVVALCEAIDAVGQRAGTPIVAVPADIDLTDDNSSDDDPAYCSAFVGILVANGGTYEPLAVPREAMLQAIEQAKAIPAAVWDEITAAYREAGGKQPSEPEIVMFLGCTGGLPMAKLAFGVLGKSRDDDEDDEDEAKGEKEEVPAGDFIRGQSPDQSPHRTGVYGQKIASCSYDGSSAKPIDIGDAAHAARIEAIASGNYYLIAQYD